MVTKKHVGADQTEFGQTNSVGQGMLSEAGLLVSEASESSTSARVGGPYRPKILVEHISNKWGL